ncbi:PREDICTED: UDP-glycosyltransferase 78D2-like [Tarenaya hassleriana]|uniref:UDP-glycosyltransferase 78D2-like n=1 Tax=Tarenaya hassleriana TaxID=28532 RepID=UPI00053C42D3|nr:PREDICTED: UDP-glycosyltransferase 78D2-like [Tarenaya hassleriana]
MAEPSHAARDTHVAVLAFPFGTHAPPLLSVTRCLAAAAPAARFSFFGTAQSNSASVGGDGLPANLRTYDVSDGVPEGYVFTGKPQEAIELFLTAAPESFRRGMGTAEAEVGRRVTCLVTDAFYWFAAEMAAEMEAVWVAFWTAGPCSLSAHLCTDLIRRTIGLQEVDGRKEEKLGFITGMEKMRVKDLPEGVVFGNLESIFSRMLHQMGLALPKASALFLNSFEELDPLLTSTLSSNLNRFLNVGPLPLSTPPKVSTLNDTYNCLAWLDNQALGSVAYISFGTVMTPPPSELQAMAEGLEASRVPFIWSLKDKDRAHLPKGFQDRTREQGLVVPWAPQVKVLEHRATGVFVTHCGWNSVLESVAGGIPMICRPFFGDQRLNGRAVEAVWEIGVTIDGGAFTRDGFVKCLDQILGRDSGRKMRGNAKKLKGLAHEAVSANGSSTQNFKDLSEIIVM